MSPRSCSSRERGRVGTVSETRADDTSAGGDDQRGVEGTGVERETNAETEEPGEVEETSGAEDAGETGSADGVEGVAHREDADETGDDSEEREDSHLDAVDAGCGCAEVWETLSEQRGE
jgi:hypothetical protein